MPFIIPADAAEHLELAVLLLAAAGDQPQRVRTITSGTHVGFDVDAELAAAIGYGVPAPETPASSATSPKSPGKKAKTGPAGDVTEGVS